MKFNSYESFLQWLQSKGAFHMDLDLDRMERALALRGDPQCAAVQVLGTNGKGSTSTFLSSLAQANGIKAGLFISPHFLDVRERVLVNGAKLSEDMWLEAAQKLGAMLPKDLLHDLTYFEFLTVLAMELFERNNVQLAIYEAGLGGAHDSTTVIPIDAQCFTPIALDHLGVIGPTIRDVAWDKARAMTEDIPVFSAPQYTPVRDVLAFHSRKRNISLYFIDPLERSIPLGLVGEHQYTNAAVASACWQYLAKKFHWSRYADRDSRGLAAAFLPGRNQVVKLPGNGSMVILDGAHNPHGVQMLLSQLPMNPRSVIFSALTDKDWRSSLAMLGRLQVPLFIPQLPVARAENAEILAAALPGATPVGGTDALAEIFELAPSPVLLCGSLYLLAEFYKNFPQFLEKEKRG